MENRGTNNTSSEELWKEFHETQAIEKKITCWVCKKMLETEFLEMECPSTNAVEVIRVDYCPRCGNRLK